MPYGKETLHKIKEIQDGGLRHSVKIPKWVAIEILRNQGFLPEIKRKHILSLEELEIKLSVKCPT